MFGELQCFRFPGIADLKMADLYLIINFFFVFAGLIEFAMVSYEPPERRFTKATTKPSKPWDKKKKKVPVPRSAISIDGIRSRPTPPNPFITEAAKSPMLEKMMPGIGSGAGFGNPNRERDPKE